PRATATGQFLDEPLRRTRQLQLFSQFAHVRLRTAELGGAAVEPQLPAALHLPPVQRSVRDLQPNDRERSGTSVASVAVQADLLPAEMNQQTLSRKLSEPEESAGYTSHGASNYRRGWTMKFKKFVLCAGVLLGAALTTSAQTFDFNKDKAGGP